MWKEKRSILINVQADFPLRQNKLQICYTKQYIEVCIVQGHEILNLVLIIVWFSIRRRSCFASFLFVLGVQLCNLEYISVPIAPKVTQGDQ